MPTIALDRQIRQIEAEATRKGIAEIAAFLQETLGQKVTAYLSGLNHAKEVGAWVSGNTEPTEVKQMRLRYAYKAARMLVAAFGEETAKSWFFGTNTRLADRAPAFILRNAEDLGALQSIIPAARDFARSPE